MARPRLGKTERIVITAHRDFRDAIFEAAKERGMSVTVFLTELIAKELHASDQRVA